MSKIKKITSIKKISTGIDGFEHVSMGGIPQGRTTLLSGTSGSGKTVFSMEFLLKGITKFNENGVFVTFEETPRDIMKNAMSFDWNIDNLIKENKFIFVDASPCSEEREIIGNYDFSALIARLEYAIKKINAKRVAMDSIASLFTQYYSEAVIRREFLKIAAILKKIGVTTILTAERIEEYGPVAKFNVEEFVSDNVMIFRNALEEEKRRRTVEILKFRGTFHKTGEYPFTITDKGLNIIPLSAIELKQRSSSARISTGSQELDKMCGGGYFKDSIILLSGATGTGKTLNVTTFLNEACKQGEKALLFAFEESREQLIRNANSWKIDYEKWEKKGLLKIVCEYPETAGLEAHLISMKKIIEDFKPSRVAVDSLSAMERIATLKSFREFVIGLTAYTKSKEVASLFTNTTQTLMGGESITETHISTITDSIILLRYVELHSEMKRGITVIKMRGSWHDKNIREFYIDNNGMHIGEAFRDVENIMIGTPRALIRTEREQIATLMDKRN